MGFKALGRVAKIRQILIAAFAGADDKGRRAGQGGIRELQLAVGAQRVGDPIHGRPGVVIAPGGEIAPQPRAAQPLQSALQQVAGALAGFIGLKVIGRVASLQGVIHRGEVGHPTGKGTNMIQTGDKRMAAGAGEATEGGFQAKDPAQRRGDANRAVGVAAEAEMDQSGRHRRGRTAGRSAGDPRQIVRVARRAIVAVFGGEAVGVGVHIEHPAEQGAGAVQLAHRPAIAGCRRPVAQQFGAGEGGVPGDIKQIFHRVRNACQRRQGALFPAQGVDAVGLRQHALGGELGPGVDLRIHAGDIVQRLAGDLPGAQFAFVQRTLDLGDGEMVKCHALYTPAISSRGPRG
ncbi:Uncharacterised protein [Klebsiella pneumoniae]|nr:Uncharacterised protein [Klebsiella pneumoniae]